jgi:hypothetical protein
LGKAILQLSRRWLRIHVFAKRINLIAGLLAVVAQRQLDPVHFQEKSVVTD